MGKSHFTDEALSGVWGSVPAPQGMGHWDLNPDLPRACLGNGGLPCSRALKLEWFQEARACTHRERNCLCVGGPGRPRGPPDSPLWPRSLVLGFRAPNGGPLGRADPEGRGAQTERRGEGAPGRLGPAAPGAAGSPAPLPRPLPGRRPRRSRDGPGGRWGRRARRARTRRPGPAGPEWSRPSGPRPGPGSGCARPLSALRPPRGAHARLPRHPSLRTGTPGGRREDMASDAVQVGAPASAAAPRPAGRRAPPPARCRDPRAQGGQGGSLPSARRPSPGPVGWSRHGPLLGRWR